MSEFGLRESNRVRTRLALQEAALALCLEGGYANLTTRAIAARANVSESTLFRAFGSKAAILCHDPFLPCFVESLVERPADGVTVGEAVREAIDAAIRAIAPEEWALEPVRRRIVYSEPEVFSTNSMILAEYSNRLRAWARDRVSSSVDSHRLRLYFAFLFTAFAVEPLTDMTSPEAWARQLHAAADAVEQGTVLV